MARKKEKPIPKFSANHVKRALGLNAVLLCLVVFFSANTRLRFLSYGFAYALGLAGLYAFLLPLLLWGLYRLFFGAKRISFRVYLAWLIFAIGMIVLFGGIGYSNLGATPDQASFEAALEAHKNAHDLAIWQDVATGAGIVGFYPSIALVSLDLSVPYVFSSIIIGIALVIFFLPLVKVWHRHFKAQRALDKAEREQYRYQQEQEGEEEEEPIRIDDDDEPFVPKSYPSEQPTFTPAPEVPQPVKEESIFVRAKKNPLPTRRSLYHGESPQKRFDDAYKNLATENPDPDLYRHNPILTSGLQEAFFDVSDLAPTSPMAMPTPPAPAAERDNAPEVSMVMFTPEQDDKPFDPAPIRHEDDEPIETPSAEVYIPEPDPAPMIEPEKPIEEELVPDFLAPEPEPIPEPTPAPAPSPRIFAPVIPQEEVVEEEEEEAPIPPSAISNNPLDKEPDEAPLPPYTLPPIDLLEEIENQQSKEAMEADIARKTEIIDKAYRDLRVGAHVVGYVVGPQVTRFAIQADDDVSVVNLGKVVKDIEVRLNGLPTRFNERVVGMSTSALEVANDVRRTVSMKELMLGMPELNQKNKMYIPFGEDIGGKVRSADFIELPHLLVAGTTRSGKTVFIHTIILALLMRNRPEELKLVLVDPKRVEMSKYRDIPHLLCPVIKEPKEAVVALKKLCGEMERRLTVFENAGVQDIQEYNGDYAEYAHKRKMPYILTVIDEFADLVMAAKDVSSYVLKLGQKARAAGIHLIVATQRPDAKVIDGTLKSNLPARVALTVASAIDSQTILGFKGAEELGGYGDMLIDCTQVARGEFLRAQSAFATAKDMRNVTDFIRKQQGPSYDPEFLNLKDEEDEVPGTTYNGSTPVNDAPPSEETLSAMKAAGVEEKYQMIKKEVMSREFTSISQIQRDYGVGFPRAGKIYARLMKEGIISNDVPNGSKGAKVIVHNIDTLPQEENPGTLSQSETSWSGEDE